MHESERASRLLSDVLSSPSSLAFLSPATAPPRSCECQKWSHPGLLPPNTANGTYIPTSFSDDCDKFRQWRLYRNGYPVGFGVSSGCVVSCRQALNCVTAGAVLAWTCLPDDASFKSLARMLTSFRRRQGFGACCLFLMSLYGSHGAWGVRTGCLRALPTREAAPARLDAAAACVSQHAGAERSTAFCVVLKFPSSSLLPRCCRPPQEKHLAEVCMPPSAPPQRAVRRTVQMRMSVPAPVVFVAMVGAAGGAPGDYSAAAAPVRGSVVLGIPAAGGYA